MGFFEGFKEKAKGAFDKITSSLGDFGSKAMETFRGLGGSLQKLFTGEGGIMKSLSGFMKGLLTGGGGRRCWELLCLIWVKQLLVYGLWWTCCYRRTSRYDRC